MKRLFRFRSTFLFFCLQLVLQLELILLFGLADSATGVNAADYYLGIPELLFSEIQYFPVAGDEQERYAVTFENSWGARRTYGGERVHEGCDLMASENRRGIYPVVSMTDGVVENVGWLEKGGWRIGIRSGGNVYYYYAHLDSYEKEFVPGDSVAAGDILGRMGDSGYGKSPGTKGLFDVHLHVGIYIKDTESGERAVNPYWYLRAVENQKLLYDYGK